MSTKPNNATVVDKCTQRLNALKEHVGNTKGTIPMNGQDLKVADVIAIYQGCLDSRTALAKYRAQVKTALATKASAEQARVSADMALSAWVITKFGAGSEEALDFGFTPRKAATRTVASKAKGILQARATRVARHTMGKKQKSTIKGTIAVSTAPAAPATNTLTDASSASQPANVVVQATTPQSAQTQDAASATPATANVTTASH